MGTGAPLKPGAPTPKVIGAKFSIDMNINDVLAKGGRDDAIALHETAQRQQRMRDLFVSCIL